MRHVLVAESGEKMRILVREFEGKCANTRLKFNPAKNKVMRIGGGDEEMWREELVCRSVRMET